MPISTTRTQMQKAKARIIACDPVQRIIQGQLQDYGTIGISVFEVPLHFRWPVVGEVWSIYMDKGFWTLGNKVSDLGETFPVENLKSGESRIDATTIRDISGNAAVTIADANVVESQVIVRQDNQWTTQPVTSLSGADKYFVWSQAVASVNWGQTPPANVLPVIPTNPNVITHSLGKSPSVSVTDSAGGLVYPDVVYIDANNVQITFGISSGAIGGFAYFN